MSVHFIQHYLFAFAFTVTSSAFAQSALSGIGSGRYESRPQAKVVESSKRRPASADVSVKLVPAPAAPPTEIVNPVKVPEAEALATSAVVKEAAKEPEKEPAIAEQVESLFGSKLSNVINFYQNNVHYEDVRNNQIEAEVLPSFIYLDADSNYSFRRYSTQFVNLGLKATSWFTPRVGLYGAFSTSLAGDLAGESSVSSRVNAKFESLDVGFSFRSFDGLSRKSNSTEFLVEYLNHKTIIPSDETSRASHQTSGLGLGVRLKLPTSSKHKWVIGGMLFPKLTHGESRTAAAGQSGEKGDSARLEFDLGGEIESNRFSQLLWNIGYSYERNTFRGTAGVADPHSGLTPANVGVSSSTLSFGLGYRWGR